MTVVPREIDTALAETWTNIYRAEQRVAMNDNELLRLAGAEFYYRGRSSQRVTDMSVDEARPIVAAEVERMQAHRVAHEGEDGLWVGWTGQIAPYDQDRAASALAKDTEYRQAVADLYAEEARLQESYTGWSRFFLVTSSAGHVHSSMSCTTCRPTTTYGWLPNLSGQDEATAVAELGGTLCTVCFPSAPSEWTEGKKLTKAQAAKKVAG